MRKYSPILLTLMILLIASTLATCDTFAPLESCGKETTANHEIYLQFFAEIKLLNLAAGAGDPDETEPQAGRIFEGATDLVIETQTIKDTTIRLCIFVSKGNGKVMFDETFDTSAGSRTIPIGIFDPAPYIVRVYADGILVENIQFVVR